MRHHNVLYERPSALSPKAHNARTHTKKQICQVAASIEEFGFTSPILVDGELRVIAGHARLAAAMHLGLERVPSIRIDDLSEAQIRAYIIADNNLAENAGWDLEILGSELHFLSEPDVEVDPIVTGIEIPEIDLIIQEAAAADESDAGDEADALPKPGDGPSVTEPGDLWQLGRHRLLCGDATMSGSYDTLLAGKTARMVFTDPPYNVPIDGHVCGLGSVRHDAFAMASGEMSEKEFTAFLWTVFGLLADHSSDGAIHYICMDWRHMGEVIAAGRDVYSELKNLCVWNKTNGGMGSLYRSKHELVFVFKAGSAPHINNVELGRHGRNRTNVWDYAGINALGAERADELAMHPTVKPAALVADAILDCSRRGDIILDAFGGSGTTIIAAERTGRSGYAIELEPKYVDVTIRRWQQAAGEDAVLADNGLTFDQVRRWRDAAADFADDPAHAAGFAAEVRHV